MPHFQALRGSVALYLCLHASACVDIPPETLEPLAELTRDASISVNLSIDAGAMRPADGDPYTGPECEPAPTPSDDAAEGEGAAGNDMSHADSAGAMDAGAATGAEPAPRPSAPGHLLITELMPNPAAVADTAGEWIELYNPGAEALDVAGCLLDDGGSTRRPLPAGTTIDAGAHFLLARSEQCPVPPDLVISFSLGNSADRVAIFCDGIEIDAVAYGEGFPLSPGVSMSLDPDAYDAVDNDFGQAYCPGRFAYAIDLGTPGEPNPSCDTDADAG
ncbi:MAG: lamin tail domain-containing protein [Myxococcales bacterium]|nr:lamin tail domain-containing protein [Myxococcales bacterium]